VSKSKIAVAAVIASLSAMSAAKAAVVLITTAGPTSAVAPTTIDFSAPFSAVGSFSGDFAVFNSSPANVAAQPSGAALPYGSVGSSQAPTFGTAELTLAYATGYFGLYWGSVDTYNKITFYDGAHNEIGFKTGSDALNPANGNQGPSGSVYANFTFGNQQAKYVKFESGTGSPLVVQAAFEFDNIATVPEASTWAMMILGFLGLGFLGYRRSSAKNSTASFRMA
jgi:hypothetical protein